MCVDFGTFAKAANDLYRVTGNANYYYDALVTVNHITSEGPVCHNRSEGCGCQWAYWFTLALSEFATDAGFWPAYGPWLQANADAAWNERSSLNLTWNDWTNPTSDTSPAAGLARDVQRCGDLAALATPQPGPDRALRDRQCRKQARAQRRRQLDQQRRGDHPVALPGHRQRVMDASPDQRRLLPDKKCQQRLGAERSRGVPSPAVPLSSSYLRKA